MLWCGGFDIRAMRGLGTGRRSCGHRLPPLGPMGHNIKKLLESRRQNGELMWTIQTRVRYSGYQLSAPLPQH